MHIILTQQEKVEWLVTCALLRRHFFSNTMTIGIASVVSIMSPVGKVSARSVSTEHARV